MKKIPKLIVITGVTQGLGRALVDRFHEAGCIIAGCGRSVTEINHLAALYSNGDFQALDVQETNKVEEWSHHIFKKLGSPDLIINNAAITNQPAPLWDVPAEEFESVIRINVIGFWNVIHAFVPTMIKQNHGILVNMSSGWGQYGAPLFGPYCTSKFAVEGMTQSLAEELPDGMAAVAVSPGMINTKMLKICVPETAHLAPTPEAWSKCAAPFLLELSAKDNGKSLQIPYQ
jgi:NAD(P)-dependent dehydrogenase (short-subunit alcohol dehydrogenase family)